MNQNFQTILIRLLALLLLTGMTTGLCAEPTKKVIFSKGDLGRLPDGWTIQATGAGNGGKWQVVEDKSAPSGKGASLAQTEEDDKANFNLCILDDSRFLDGTIKVSIKPNKGKMDQGGGIVFRFANPDNYYIARMNPLESNLRLYKVVAGKRIQLATTDDNLLLKPATWYSLSIRHAGKKIEVLLDGKKLLEAEDGTFMKSGKVGLWTKSDARTSFDMLVLPSD